MQQYVTVTNSVARMDYLLIHHGITTNPMKTYTKNTQADTGTYHKTSQNKEPTTHKFVAICKIQM